MGECFFWYRPTRVVPDQRPLNGRCCCTRHTEKYLMLQMQGKDASVKPVTVMLPAMSQTVDEGRGECASKEVLPYIYIHLYSTIVITSEAVTVTAYTGHHQTLFPIIHTLTQISWGQAADYQLHPQASG